MMTILKGMPRPSAVSVRRGGYREVDLSDPENPEWTERRVDVIGHEPCGWNHPTWPDEAEGRLAAHLLTCELR